MSVIAAAALLGCVHAASPGDAVLVLGYGEGYPGDEPGAVEVYHTAVFVLSPDSVRRVADVSGIVLPLSTGFGRIGVSVVCEEDSRNRTTNYHQSVWRSDGGEPPDDKPAVPCRGATGSRPGSMVCDDYRARILFAAPRLLSTQMTTQQTSECEPRGGHFWTSARVHMTAGKDSLSLTAIFDSSTIAAAYDRAMRQGFADLRREGFNCPEPSPDAYSYMSWGIEHQHGMWKPVAQVSEFGIWGECEFSQSMDLSLPDSLTGDASDGKLWSRLVTAIPDLTDYVASPGGEFVVAIAGKPGNSTIAVYRNAAPSPRKIWEGQWGARNNIVMVRWGAGAEAARWTAILTRLSPAK